MQSCAWLAIRDAERDRLQQAERLQHRRVGAVLVLLRGSAAIPALSGQ